MNPDTGRFPFTAVVGQDQVKLALLLAAVDPAIGGVLLRGQKGSAKTTLARGLAGLLRPGAPFVELPLGATEDRLLGSVDLAAALTGGEVRFRPGLLAAADGGVLYVDEVNLLADHLVDALLDVAVTGVNRVEREGISHVHPSRFVLIGSMNPEEGDLRPQLLDRFGFAVDVVTSPDPDERAEAVRRRLAFDADHDAFRAAWSAQELALGADLDQARAGQAELPPELLRAISALCAQVGAEGLRADLVIGRGAVARAVLDGRPQAMIDDVREVAPLALAHRRRRHPMEDPGISPEELDRALPPGADRPAGPPDSGDRDDGRGEPRPQGEVGPEDGRDGSAPRLSVPAPPSGVVPLEVPRAVGGAAGRRSTVEDGRGRLVTDRAPTGAIRSVAVTATLQSAAVRRAVGGGAAVPVQRQDLREAVRERRAGNLVILAVDASGSMGARRRMEAAKGAVISLLLDAYQRRDRVALVTFRGAEAEVALRPTGSVEVARAKLGELATGGRTPLAAGIAAALRLAQASSAAQATGGGQANDGHRPLIVLVSDGRATAAPEGVEPLGAAFEEAAAVRRRRVAAVVVDAEEGPGRLGLARELAEAMGARHLSLEELSADALAGAVRAATAGE